MYRLDAHKPVRFCDGLTRRDFLHAGSLSALGLALPGLRALEARGAVDRNRDVNRDRNTDRSRDGDRGRNGERGRAGDRATNIDRGRANQMKQNKQGGWRSGQSPGQVSRGALSCAR